MQPVTPDGNRVRPDSTVLLLNISLAAHAPRRPLLASDALCNCEKSPAVGRFAAAPDHQVLSASRSPSGARQERQDFWHDFSRILGGQEVGDDGGPAGATLASPSAPQDPAWSTHVCPGYNADGSHDHRRGRARRAGRAGQGRHWGMIRGRRALRRAELRIGSLVLS